MTLSKYNELMENIVVTEDMKNRILHNIELELDGGNANGGKGSSDNVISIDTASENKKVRKFGSTIRGRWASYAAAVLVLVVSGVVVRSVIGGSSHSSSSSIMEDASADAAPSPAAMEEAAECEEAMDNSKQIDSAEPVAKDSASPEPAYEAEAEEGAAMAEADYVLSIKIRRAGASDESEDMYESIDVGEVVYSGISELVVKKITDTEIVFTSDGGLIEPNENGSINLNATPPKTFTVKAGEEKVLVTQTTDGSDKITISYNGM